MSCLYSLSQFPKGTDIHPGIFALLYLGVYTYLDTHSQFFFSGQQMHVGTSPWVPAGVTPHPAAHRVNLIGYAPGKLLEGAQRYLMGATPFDRNDVMPPEVLNTK